LRDAQGGSSCDPDDTTDTSSRRDDELLAQRLRRGEELLIEAFLWGALASSSLLVGAVLALRLGIGERVLGLVMAFGAGVLISAVAFELYLEASEIVEHRGWMAAGLFAGALTFYVGDTLIDRMGGEGRKSMGGRQAGGAALAIVLGIVLDGIPESFVVGIDLLSGEGVSAAFIAAVFLSNLPESAAASSGLARAGWEQRHIYALWAGVTLVAGVAAALGNGLFGDASPDWIAFLLAFAAGAILTMLADTMMPEAFEKGGKAAGLLTTLGFATAVLISSLE
jgi:zinc transporter, ZIP family